MAVIGGARDMDKWSSLLRAAGTNRRFPGESSEYRSARDELLKAEAELRRLNEEVAAQRRALPLGGLIPEDYVFEAAGSGRTVRFSELFAPGKDTLVVYSMMFPRWSEDPRASAPGRMALLPMDEQPCPSCTSVVDGIDGFVQHLAARINVAVVAKTSAARLGAYAADRGWHNLQYMQLLSAPNNTFNRDYHAETPDGEQVPMLNVFSREQDGIHHRWGAELMFDGGDSRHLDSIWPIWSVLDLTPDGRGAAAAYPTGQYA
ncbi:MULTISPECIES: DUF899 family protein [Streptomyces]|uniref:DUF899 family protein n=1 Tax=Streptomyces gibsoniae TaxID=3075529 RepID=A0ABU2U1Z3_9ACTN|nr:DUF899 family protein [Streptomyces sp. DSM 41699]MDT0467067.1 DUF899 family protein [Streptomyces sp. DSM 41699]